MNSPKRLIQRVADQIHLVALCRPLLLAVDGLSSYVGAFRRAFRSPLPRRGVEGRRRLIAWPDIAIVQVVKQRSGGDFRIDRRIVQGGKAMVERLLTQSLGGKVINTAYILTVRSFFMLVKTNQWRDDHR